MKRPERIGKVWKWLLIDATFFVGLFIPLSLACLAHQLMSVNTRLAEKISSWQTISFWHNFVPEGSVEGVPFTLILMLVMVIVVALITGKLRHHWSRLNDEDKQRDV